MSSAIGAIRLRSSDESAPLDRYRFGIKPLFYAIHNQTLFLASEAKALFAAGVPARWDAESVGQAVEFGGHPVRTLFDGVLQVPPGHYLLATDKHVQLVPDWDFNYPLVGTGTPRSDTDYAAEFRHSFDCRQCTRTACCHVATCRVFTRVFCGEPTRPHITDEPLHDSP